MKKVNIIGDCHAARILEHWNPKTCPVDLKVWGKAGFKAYDLNIKELHEYDEPSSGIESFNDNILQTFRKHEDTILNFQNIKNGELIMPWAGYVDIRQFLPKYKNADLIVKKYVEEFINFYDKSVIRFIEPLPQFTEMLLKYEGIHPSYSYEERLEQNRIFIDSLRKYSEEYGLQKPISQEEIYKAVGVQEFTTDLTPQNGSHPVDALTPNYMNKIYNLFIEESVNTLDDPYIF
jgi:hypothetical protein